MPNCAYINPAKGQCSGKVSGNSSGQIYCSLHKCSKPECQQRKTSQDKFCPQCTANGGGGAYQICANPTCKKTVQLGQKHCSKECMKAEQAYAGQKQKKTGKKGEDDEQCPLERFGIDLTARAAEGKLDPVIGRDDEVRRAIRILCRRTKNNPVLIGEPGVGKTAIVEGLAQRIYDHEVPEALNCQLISLDMGALVAGAKFRGEFEDRLRGVLTAVQESEKGVILFIDEIHLVLGAGKTEGSMDAANLLKPMLARGELRCIGATTLAEYRKHVEKDAAFERRFQQVHVPEPSLEATVSILRGLKEKYEQHHGVRVQDQALVLAATLSSRYIQNRFLPDKAIDLVDEACAGVRVQLDSRPEIIDVKERRLNMLEVEAAALTKEGDCKSSAQRLQKVQKELAVLKEELLPLRAAHNTEKTRAMERRALKKKQDEIENKIKQMEHLREFNAVADLRYEALPEVQQRLKELDGGDGKGMMSEIVNGDAIADVVSRWTGVPTQKLTANNKDRLLLLQQGMSKRVFGQPHVTGAVAEAIQRSRAGMMAPQRPTGSFLFLGPPGIGKTEMAKTLAQELFDDDRHIVRIDMSEYTEAHSVARLIGAPPGYVGHDEAGQLTEAVRRRPYNVVLFDDIDRAHHQVLSLLLQILDEGALTDSQGNRVDFCSTVVIMTSCLGADPFRDGVESKGVQAETPPVDKEKVMRAVRKHFKPDFLNRVDDICVFNNLTVKDIKGIVEKEITTTLSKRLEEKHIKLSVTHSAIDAILRDGYWSDPAQGVRQVKRYLERSISTKISQMLLSGEVTEHGKVSIDQGRDGKLVFTFYPTNSAQEQPRERRAQPTMREARGEARGPAPGPAKYQPPPPRAVA